jgi:hypothetical protein
VQDNACSVDHGTQPVARFILQPHTDEVKNLFYIGRGTGTVSRIATSIQSAADRLHNA